MPDKLGYRAKWGLVVPARNTVCETELHRTAPPGITINTARATWTPPLPRWTDDRAQKAMAQSIRNSEPAAIEQLLACKPDYIIIGEGGFSFTRAEHEAMGARYDRLAGVGVATSARAFLHALEVLGARSLAVLTPRLPDSGVVSGGLWQECGYRVTAGRGMNCNSAFEIVDLAEYRIFAALGELASTKPDVILATGSNFLMMHLADDAERRFGVPVLHVNTVLFWHALRDSGFDDKIPRLGMILRDH